ncbi:hydroxyacid dehydrogenase [Candidatus Wirthbacteria bacterium CG2_30_54_11]|uniref:Hydroxyacid dehydrogenase n=1 Tax=Candidatus Wirthbacteria bacterium CG2_30_54_11 TaxID=1817892 RepID=A0A1J5IE19_9BACT|nr:MAG: hydroxyacid dehydrogenase [Candidatus Wirthbacteria bacterium CG2_30_54_11]
MANEIVLYQNADGTIRLETRLENGTLWLSQQQMAELFLTTVPNVSMHIKNVVDEGELSLKATVQDFLTVRQEGGRQVQRTVTHYNLDMVISIGYRIKSRIATRFRIWATQRLKEYIVKGFVMDDERLKNPPIDGSSVPDHFDDLLARIRDIRASERRLYLRVREIFALAADYEPGLPETSHFFSLIQNKLHFAATGHTAAELIALRADHDAPHMGLTSWARGEIRKTDVTIAKNYLDSVEIAELNRIVTMWLDFAEDQATRRKQIFMMDWQVRLDEFLRFNDRQVLPDAGTVTKKEADEKAEGQYEQFAVDRRETRELQAETDLMQQIEATTKVIAKRQKVQSKKGK